MKANDTILLVEDNRDDVFIFKKALKAAAITNPVTVLTNGKEAVDYLSTVSDSSETEKPPLPSVIFLDLKMPYLNGFEVLNWIRQQPALQSVVTVVLSGSNESKDHQRAYALGARSYLVKPPKPDEIRQFMDSMGSRWERRSDGY